MLADRVRLYPIATSDTSEPAETVAEYERIAELVGLETTVTDPLESFRELYCETFTALRDDLERGHDVWVNVAGATNPIGFAPITAVTSLTFSSPPNRIRVYAADDDGQLWPIPTAVQVPTTESGESILETIDQDEPDSVTELGRSLSNDEDVELDDTFRSKIQYNAGRLKERGLIRMVDDGYRKQPERTAAGDLYLETPNTHRMRPIQYEAQFNRLPSRCQYRRDRGRNTRSKRGLVWIRPLVFPPIGRIETGSAGWYATSPTPWWGLGLQLAVILLPIVATVGTSIVVAALVSGYFSRADH